MNIFSNFHPIKAILCDICDAKDPLWVTEEINDLIKRSTGFYETVSPNQKSMTTLRLTFKYKSTTLPLLLEDDKFITESGVVPQVLCKVMFFD